MNSTLFFGKLRIVPIKIEFYRKLRLTSTLFHLDRNKIVERFWHFLGNVQCIFGSFEIAEALKQHHGINGPFL